DELTDPVEDPVTDPLLESLVFLTAHYGRAKSAEAIRAGLAYDEKGMGPALFCEAAQRLRFKTKIVRRSDPWQLDAATLPAVLILKNNRACVLLSLKAGGGKAKIFLPETGGAREIGRKELLSLYAGYVVFVHP